MTAALLHRHRRDKRGALVRRMQVDDHALLSDLEALIRAQADAGIRAELCRVAKRLRELARCAAARVDVELPLCATDSSTQRGRIPRE